MLSLYLLTNQSPGYGEPELALVAGHVRHNGGRER